jgi:hypothetical protein
MITMEKLKTISTVPFYDSKNFVVILYDGSVVIIIFVVFQQISFVIHLNLTKRVHFPNFFFYFSSNFNAVFCKMFILMSNLWATKENYLFFKKNLERGRYSKISHIWKIYKFSFCIQFWHIFIFDGVETLH